MARVESLSWELLQAIEAAEKKKNGEGEEEPEVLVAL